MSRGVLYIAMGEDFITEAELSAETVKRETEDIPVAVITDRKVTSDYFDSIISVDDVNYDFGDIVRNIDRSPFEKTLYLDTDIYVDQDISEIFSLLDEFDIAASTDPTGWHMEKYDFDHPVKDVPEGFPWYNGGVIGFVKGNRTNDFFDLWQSSYKRDLEEGIIHNMPSLRHALYFSDVRISTLPRRYNCVFREPDHVLGSVKIFHGRLRDLETPGASREYDVDTARQELNKSTKSRVYIPLYDGSFEVIDSNPVRLTVRYKSSNLLYRILGSIQRNGVITTASAGYGKIRNSIFF